MYVLHLLSIHAQPSIAITGILKATAGQLTITVDNAPPHAELAEGGKPSRVGIPVIEDGALFRIDVPERDRWILDTAFHETSFYIDFKFQSEEEQDFVPLIREYDASTFKPGRHIATVQLFGFGGFNSSDTVEFLVAP